jgi:signal transduction histidine kinase
MFQTMSRTTKDANRPRKTIGSELSQFLLLLFAVSTLFLLTIGGLVLLPILAKNISRGAELSLQSDIGRDYEVVSSEALWTRPLIRLVSSELSERQKTNVSVIEIQDQMYYRIDGTPPQYAPVLQLDRIIALWVLLSVLLLVGFLLLAARWYANRISKPLQGIAELGVDQNIAELVELADTPAELLQLAEQVQESFQRERASALDRARYLNGFAHDIGTPIMRLQLALSLLQERGLPAQQDWLKQMHDDLEYLSALRAQWLAQVRDNQSSLTRIDIVSIARGIGDRMFASLWKFFAPDALEIDMPALVFTRLVENLMQNALQHGVAPFSAEISGSSSAWQLGIESAGQISTSQLQALLAWCRGDRASVNDGLGLQIVHSIAVQYGLQLSVQRSELGGLHLVVFKSP